MIMKIKNQELLEKNDIKRHSLDILESGVNSALPATHFKQNISYSDNKLKVCDDVFDISKSRLFIIGGGKASGGMAHALEEIIPLDKITEGLVNTTKPLPLTNKIVLNEAAHPIPDDKGFEGVQKMLEMTENLNENDLVISLISGGGSALLPAPVEGLSLKDKQILNDILIKCGVDHYEINIIRKLLSKIKGGKLAKHVQPAKIISLIVSDDSMGKDDVASGPSFADEVTFDDAFTLLSYYNVLDTIPKSVLDYINLGMNGKVPATPKKDEPFWKNVYNYTLADNKKALEAMGNKAKELGYKPIILKEVLIGEVRDGVKRIIPVIDKYSQNDDEPIALIFSTEMTLIPGGKGLGGRNQEFVAYLIEHLPREKRCVMASIDSDGKDFMQGISGAMVDNDSWNTARKKGLPIEKFIENHDTHALHEELESLIYGEQTGTNVGDLNVYLQGEIK